MDDSPSTRGTAVASVLRRHLEQGPRWLDVDGPSMGTTIRAGDRVRVAAAAEPRRGEIWAFCKESGRVVVHRFRRRIDGHYNFQGDAVWRSDEPVDRRLLIGRVVAVERGGVARRVGLMRLITGRLTLDIGTLRTRARRVWRRRAARLGSRRQDVTRTG